MEEFPADSPFYGLKISSHDPLRQVTSRHVCEGCKKSSRYFCYRCITLAPDLSPSQIPTVRLPLHLCIVKDKRELEGKTTAVHAKLIAPEDVSIIEYDRNLGPDGGLRSSPDLRRFDLRQTVVLFPSAESKSVQSIDWSNVKQLVLLDGTWQQAKGMCNACPVLSSLPKVHLTTEQETVFWRYQHIGPHCLSTIEAIHQFYREFSAQMATGEAIEKYDDLLYFFSFLYNLIQEDYRSNPGRPFTRKHGKSTDYIKYSGEDQPRDDDQICM